MRDLQQLITALESYLPELQRQRSSSDFANDLFEAVDDLCHLAHYILKRDTRIDYPVRVRQEQQLWKTLEGTLSKRPAKDQALYGEMFREARQVLRFAETIRIPEGGHLGILRVIRQQFKFVETEYGYRVVHQSPIGVRYSSGAVYLELKWAKRYASSCWFGPESNSEDSFSIDDLLFMYGDKLYRTLPQDLGLETERDVQRWFGFLASMFGQYGREVLSNQLGIFERLATAQAERDRERTREMDEIRRNSTS